MAKCDLCNESCVASGMTQLLTMYQTDGIVDLCPACKSWADKTKNDMVGEIAPRLREAIRVRAGKPLPWWRRLF